MPKQEKTLVIAAQNGDESAAEKLASENWERVFGYVYRLTSNWNDAEDIAQETFLRAFKNLGGYRPEGPFNAWLMRIATNLFIDHRKSRRRHDATGSEITYVPCASFLEPEQTAQRNEFVSAVWDAVQNLSHEQKAAILMRGVERMEYTQIADLLEVSESTARWHMYEARRILRKRLNGSFDSEGVIR